MSGDGVAIVERIDHGVIPSNDLGRGFRFWSNLMGGVIAHMTNFNARGLNREVPQMLFLTVANHRGWGLALQDFSLSTTPHRMLDGVAWGFEVDAPDLSQVIEAAAKHELRIEGPVTYPASSPIQESIFFLDPDGNTVELCIRRDPSSQNPQGTIFPLRRISHVRVEVTDLQKGRDWYCRVFGLVEDNQGPGDDQVTLTVPRSGQLIILRKVDRVADRSTQCVRGPHIDFRIPLENYPTVFERFEFKERYWGADPTKIPWHEPNKNTVYGYDPFGNRIQIGAAYNRGHGH